MQNSTVMVFGTFDIFHQGHASFLKQARAYGNHLIAVVARDETVEKVKGGKPMQSEYERLEMIKTSGLADKVVLGEEEVRYKIIESNRPDVICLGYDQTAFLEGFRKRLDAMGLQKTKVIRLKPYKPEKYKSSKLKL